MTSKLRLLGSLALGVVGAASAHGQAFGSADGYAQINVVGFYTLDGRVATGTSQYLGQYHSFDGPFAYGDYQFGDYVGWTYDGTFAQANGYSYAAPVGYVQSSAVIENTIEFTNFHVYGVHVEFYGTTFASALGQQNHAGDSGGGLAIADLALSTGSQFYAFQISEIEAIADNYFGEGNYWFGSNYDAMNGSTTGSQFYGFGSPGSVSMTYSLTNLWSLYIAPYSSIAVSEEVYEAHYAGSTQPGVPGPVAVAPFAVGLLGALRRRSKK